MGGSQRPWKLNAKIPDIFKISSVNSKKSQRIPQIMFSVGWVGKVTSKTVNSVIFRSLSKSEINVFCLMVQDYALYDWKDANNLSLSLEDSRTFPIMFLIKKYYVLCYSLIATGLLKLVFGCHLKFIVSIKCHYHPIECKWNQVWCVTTKCPHPLQPDVPMYKTYYLLSYTHHDTCINLTWFWFTDTELHNLYIIIIIIFPIAPRWLIINDNKLNWLCKYWDR